MPAALNCSILDEARDPLFRLIVRNWILRGRQRVDGLICVKAWSRKHWLELLLPWLDRAEEVQESASHVWLRFADPIEIDCELLGGLLPLRRQYGVLSSAEIDVPVASIATSLKETMILHLHGERYAVPLSSFSHVDIGGQWDMSAVTLLDAIALPLLNDDDVRHILKTRVGVPFDPADAQAGFGDLRQRVVNAKGPGIWRRFADGWHNNVHLLKWFAVMALMIFIGGVIFTITKGMPDTTPTDIKRWPEIPPTDAPFDTLNWLIWIIVAIIVFIIVLATLSVRTRAGANALARNPGTATGPNSALVQQGWLRRLVNWMFSARSKRAAASAPSGTVGTAIGPNSALARSGWLRRVINWMLGARSKAASSTTPRPAGPATPRERGWLGRVAAWLVWHTPLRNALVQQYERHLQELDRLFQAGRLEEALKRALALSGEQDLQNKPKTAYGDMPLSGPLVRERLELDLSGARATSRVPLSREAYEHFLRLYRDQAKRLFEAGDLESAIFVYAELLNDAKGAIDLLIKAGRLETAARLAQARRLPPGFFIPLWFRAGNKQRALDLAARHEAFAELWKELKPGDPFRAVVGLEWARRLAASGHYGRALAISDELTDDVTAERQEWIRRALQGPRQGELIARALIILPWRSDESEGPYTAFQQLLQAGPDFAEERVTLAELLVNPAFEKRGRGDQFTARLPLLAHHLAKRLAVDEAEFGHDSRRAVAALRLSEEGRQFAFRVDLRRSSRVPKPHLAPAQTSLELMPSPALAAIIDAVVVSGRRVLIAYHSGLVKLVDFAGREIWREQVNGLHGLVPVGMGHTVLLVRDDLGERRLSVLETAPLRHRDLGRFPVAFYHPWASADTWLVFSGRNALCIDVASLLGGETVSSDSEFVKHWAIPMSEPGRPLFFLDKPGEVHFVYERRDGLVEWWSLQKSSLGIACLYWTNPPRDAGDLAVSVDFIVSSNSLWTSASALLAAKIKSANREEELDMIAQVQPGQPPLVSIQPAASLEALRWRASGHERGIEWFGRSSISKEPFRVNFIGAEWVHAHPHLHDPLTTVFDELGRLLVIDVKESKVLMKIV